MIRLLQWFGVFATAAGVYVHVAARSFQKHLAYRAANLAGIATNAFFGAIYVLIYLALFQGRDTVGGLDVRDTVTYVVLNQSLLMVMSAFGNRELSEAIINGTIVGDLCRPVDFYLYWAALDLGRAAYYLIFRGIPTFVIGLVLFRARLPADARAWLLFLAAVGVGAIVSFAFRFITHSLAFWTSDARGIIYLTNTVIMFFSGFIVPLNFLPGWLAAVTGWLPLRALAHLPASIYLGKLDGPALAAALGQQVLWLTALVLIGRWVLGRMVRRVTLYGG